MLDRNPPSYRSFRKSRQRRDQVHAVGGQFGLTYIPWVLSVNVHGFYEYEAQDRFQGGSFGVNIAKKF